jgi:co-chaperonin GroES (HSP10)
VPEFGTPAFLQWWIAECRARAEAQIPLKLNPKVWNFCPLGHRMVFLRHPPEATTPAGLVIPASAQRAMHVGWVVSVGYDINVPEPSRYPSVCAYKNPLDLVGEMGLIGHYSGAPLHFDSLARDNYESNYLVVTIGDYWGPLFEEKK